MISIKNKSNFFISIGMFIFMLLMLLSKMPIGYFPQEEDLEYTTGIFHKERVAKHTNHIRLSQIGTDNDTIMFSCSHNLLGSTRASSCGDNKFLEPYDGKLATIGWYEQKEFMGIKGNQLQLVTIEIDGVMMRDYEHTVRNRRKQRLLFIPALLFILFMSILSYRLVNKIDEKSIKS